MITNGGSWVSSWQPLSYQDIIELHHLLQVREHDQGVMGVVLWDEAKEEVEDIIRPGPIRDGDCLSCTASKQCFSNSANMAQEARQGHVILIQNFLRYKQAALPQPSRVC